MNKKKTQKIVREGYAEIAKQGNSCCTSVDSCCGTTDSTQNISKKIGYTEEELKSVPEGADMALGCGNPVAIASLKEGETVLDLGSGPGLDCFLASDKVGRGGKVIGIDMTPEMLEKARENARKGNYSNVEFRLGEIENLPVADNSVDVVISNCVINLSTDKQRVYQEIYRALKPGGRVAISDIALNKKLPEKVQESIDAYIGCVAGAVLIDEYKKMVESSRLKDVKITAQGISSCIEPDTKDPIGRAILDSLGKDESLEGYLVSVYVEGHKLL